MTTDEMETAKNERDSAIVTAYNRGVELAEVKIERDLLKADKKVLIDQRDRLRDALEIVATCNPLNVFTGGCTALGYCMEVAKEALEANHE